VTEATAMIKLNGESEDFTKMVGISVYTEDGDTLNNITFMPEQTLAKVSLVKATNLKTVGIKVKTQGDLLPGYYISDIKVAPETVDIIGSKEILDTLSYVETSPIDINGLSSSFSKDALVVIKDGAALQANSIQS
jgi:YbbR domain-containing protein